MHAIDDARAIELLEAAVAERGADYVYVNPDSPLCLYVHTSYPEGSLDEDPDNAVPIRTPGCIVGTAFILGGLIDARRMSHHLGSISSIAEVLQGRDGIDITHSALEILQRAQWAQDAKATWGEALAYAKDRDMLPSALNLDSTHDGE